MTQTIIATTPAEVQAFKSYLYKHYHKTSAGHNLDELYNFKDEDHYLWIRFKNNKLISHQTASQYTGKEFNRIISEYFTPSNKRMPFYAFINPSEYPEYHI